MNPNSRNLNHLFGESSAATIGKKNKVAKLLSGAEMIHPFKHFGESKFKTRDPAVILYCGDYISHIGSNNCYGKYNKVTKCTCIADLFSDEDLTFAAQQCLVAHGGRSDETQHEFLLEWERDAKSKMNSYTHAKWKGREFKGLRKRNKPFTLSGVTCPESLSSYSVCRNGFMKFFGIGPDAMKSIEKRVNEGGLVPKVHGLTDQKGNHSLRGETKESLRKFLNDLKGEAEPHASKVVRLATGLVMQDDDDKVELPSSYTKRTLYSRWCWLRGWDLKPKGGDGSYGRISDYQKRVNTPGTFDELLWPEGSQSLPVCSKTAFCKFWDDKFKDLVIKKSSHDTCGVCYLFMNALTGLRRREVQAQRLDVRENRLLHGVTEVELSEDEGEMFDLEEKSHDETDNVEFEFVESQSSLSCQIIRSVYGGDDVPDEFDEIDNERNKKLLEMDQHVREYTAQRDLLKNRSVDAKDDLANDVRWGERRDVFVADYSQNMGLPHHGNEQPGETYYYSPLSIHVFGVCNYATELLNAYVYDESEGKKGGNNVASLLYKNLEVEGIIKDWKDSGKKPGKRLTLCFDNCPGQNKNKMVIRFGLWLVDMGIYDTVEIIFLIAGHTKNICDRRFKDMKKDCHKEQIFSLVTLVQLMNKSAKVNAVIVSHEDFFDWNKLQDEVYGPLKAGEVLINHVFIFEAKCPATIKYARVIYSEFKTQTLPLNSKVVLTNQDHQIRRQKVRESVLEGLKKIGLKPIKQVELWSKWGPLIQDEVERNALCPKPPDEIISKVKGDKSKNAAAKKAVAVSLLEGTSTTASLDASYVPPNKPMNRWLKKENKAWLQHKGLSTIGDAKELKDRVKNYFDSNVTLAAGQVCADDVEASIQHENV